MSGQQAEASESRRAERRAVVQRARLRQRGAKAIEVEVHDLSTHGFQVDTVHVIRPGDLVWLQFGPLAPLEAQVRWFRNYRLGCAFSQPLHPAVLDTILAQAV